MKPPPKMTHRTLSTKRITPPIMTYHRNAATSTVAPVPEDRVLEPDVVREVPAARRSGGREGVPALWGIEDAEAFEPAGRWAQGVPGPVVPIGVADDGSPVALDLREGAEGGAGPHAL